MKRAERRRWVRAIQKDPRLSKGDKALARELAKIADDQGRFYVLEDDEGNPVSFHRGPIPEVGA